MLALPLLATIAVVTAHVPVVVGPELPPGVLEAALEEADAIFAPGGVRFRWQPGAAGELAPRVPVVIVRNAPPVRQVHGCQRNRHDHRLGHTNLRTRRITLWSHQVARAVVGEWESEAPPDVGADRLARALGRVLAHELGHLFLGLNGHRERGLMRRSFSRRSLAASNRRAFRLRAADFALIRSEVAQPSTPEAVSASRSTGASRE
jgi:hypothetical protein